MSSNPATVANRVAPPRAGLSLGWLLALYTSLAVTVVMGAVTVLQEVHETRQELQEIEQGLRSSLTPLVADIANAGDLGGIEARIAAFHHAYVNGGDKNHQLTLVGRGDRTIFSTFHGRGRSDPGEYHRGAVLIFHQALPEGQGQLTVFESNVEYRAHVRARWRRWGLHLGLTLASILIVLHVTIRILVNAPLDRLLDAIRKMEMGYWGEVEQVGGAWEIRWINWRFHNMGRELQETVQRLLDAERRASLAMSGAASRPARPAGRPAFDPLVDQTAHGDAMREFLELRCRELETTTSSGHREQVLAHAALAQHAFTAERAGDMPLKCRLENAAFRVLEPTRYRELEDQLATLSEAREAWLVRCKLDLGKALEKRKVPMHSLQSRCKHIAGVWKKMQDKGLNIDQIHDLFAIRVVVSTEADCYWALRVAHDTFSPVVGRFKDYVAHPKANGYKSIHTCVRTADGQVVEIQIRSVAMHQMAERGDASHVLYKLTGSAHGTVAGKVKTPRNLVLGLFRRR